VEPHYPTLHCSSIAKPFYENSNHWAKVFEADIDRALFLSLLEHSAFLIGDEEMARAREHN
jgi:hypothetical protein